MLNSTVSDSISSARTIFCAISSLVVALISGTSATFALAQSPMLPDKSITHTVVAGDTLGHLALRYLGDAHLWQELQKHNNIADPNRLRLGSTLEIPSALMYAAPALVGYIHGDAQIERNGDIADISDGMALQEGDQITLPNTSYLTIRLADGSIVQVRADSQLTLHQLRRRGRAGNLDSILEIKKGGLEVRTPAPNAKRKLQIITPVSSTSIRGTIFDVQLTPEGYSSTSVLRGSVSVQSLANSNENRKRGVALLANHGIAVSATGHALPVENLLHAPSLMPLRSESAHWLDIPLPSFSQASAWQVSVSHDEAGLQVFRNGQFKGNVARFAAPADGNYFVHLRAINTQGILGIPSTTTLHVKAHPVPPLLQAPAPDTLLPQGEARLQCTLVEGVTGYLHEIIRLAEHQTSVQPTDFANPVLQHQSVDECVLNLDDLDSGSYAWRAASIRTIKDQPDQGPFSDAQIFKVAPKPNTPSMQSSVDGGLVTLRWKAEPNQKFRIQVFDAPNSTNATLDTVLQQALWRATDLPAGTWYIRIQAQDPSGLNSAFSPPRTIEVLPLVLDGFGQPIKSGYGLGVQHN